LYVFQKKGFDLEVVGSFSLMLQSQSLAIHASVECRVTWHSPALVFCRLDTLLKLSILLGQSLVVDRDDVSSDDSVLVVADVLRPIL
jgi:hypothetical protein